MNPTYIIKPRGISSTPNALKQHLQAEKILRSQQTRSHNVVYNRDLFLYYPSPVHINFKTDQDYQNYHRAFSFCISNKKDQRLLLQELGFKVPKVFTNENEAQYPLIKRPLKHRGGLGFSYHADGSSLRFNPFEEYLQEAYSKTHEYRIIMVRGHVVVTLLKRVNEGASPLEPWNHSNGSTFITVHHRENNRLRFTPVYDIINSNQDFFKIFDICALDIMMNTTVSLDDYRVCELNLCPSLRIEDNLRKVVDHVRNLNN